MNRYRSLLYFLIVMSAILMSSCKKDKLDPVCSGDTPSYNNTIKVIIDNSCTMSGCHGLNSDNGDFTTYLKLKPYLDNGHLKKHVLKKQDMPVGFKLTQEELNLIQCWVENDYAE